MVKQILSKKSLNSLKVMEVLNQSSLSIFVNYSGSNFKETFVLKNFLSKHNLKVIHSKNKPLINSLENTKYNKISSVFQGNSLIIYQDKSIKQHSDQFFINLLLEKDFIEFLFENDKILPVGFLLGSTFLSPYMVKSFVKRLDDLDGSTTFRLLHKVINDIPNRHLQGQLVNTLYTIEWLRSFKK